MSILTCTQLSDNLPRKIDATKMGANSMRAIDWVAGPQAGHIRLIDQTRLPGSLVELEIHTVDQLVDAIRPVGRARRPRARGGRRDGCRARRRHAAGSGGPAGDRIGSGRPGPPPSTWLRGWTGRSAAFRAGGPGDALAAALQLRDDDIAACRSMARRGVELLGELCPEPRPAHRA